MTTALQVTARIERPAPNRVKARHSKVVGCLLAAALALTSVSVPRDAAAQGNLPLIRDTEIESLIRDYSLPVFQAAGISRSNIQIYLLNSQDFNAFVADGRRMFINVGSLMQTETPNQIIGVIAHEAGHIAGGHLARMREQLSATRATAIIGVLLGAAAAAAAGAAGGGTAAGGAGQATILGGQQIAQRNFLAYRRTEETAADRAAVNYLNATGQSAKGMIDVFSRFADQALFSSRFVDPYIQSHPIPNSRIATLEDVVKRSPYYDRLDPPALQLRHDMMRAKLRGFLKSPRAVFLRYPKSDTSMPARYARAIARFRTANVRAAIRDIDALIKSQPNNPYFWELKGQALLESGKPKQAIRPLRQAVSLKPNAGLIRILLGQALVASNDKGNIAEAVKFLRRGLELEPEASGGYRQLAIAYGRTGQDANAALASANGYLNEGAIKLAKLQATRAKSFFKRGSPGWLQADDILNIREKKGS